VLSIATKINDLGWPWIDLERLLCAPLHYTRLSKPTTKFWMKIDPYYQRQKCSPKIAVSSKIKIMRIFVGVRWRRGFKWEWGRRKWRFSLILPPISSELSHLRPQLLPREATRSAVLPRQVVRLSVCDVEVSWSYTLEFWKIISRLISLISSLFADPNMMDLLQREHPQILAGIGVG